jgi:hypothetical protein
MRWIEIIGELWKATTSNSAPFGALFEKVLLGCDIVQKLTSMHDKLTS